MGDIPEQVFARRLPAASNIKTKKASSMDKELILKYLETASKIKKIMKSKNIRKSRCKCPYCDNGEITAVLAGKRDHLHAKCSTSGCFQIME